MNRIINEISNERVDENFNQFNPIEYNGYRKYFINENKKNIKMDEL